MKFRRLPLLLIEALKEDLGDTDEHRARIVHEALLEEEDWQCIKDDKVALAVAFERLVLMHRGPTRESFEESLSAAVHSVKDPRLRWAALEIGKVLMEVEKASGQRVAKAVAERTADGFDIGIELEK